MRVATCLRASISVRDRTFCITPTFLSRHSTGRRVDMSTIDQATATGNGSGQGAEGAEGQPLIMQIVVRRDLLETANWGVGPLMAQVSHATAAVLHETRERIETIEYLSDLRNMHTVVLQVPSASAILALADKLSTLPAPAKGATTTAATLPPFHLWIEQPENEPSCLALAPSRRGDKAVRKVLDKAGARVWR
ncbi:hypothetical protein PENSPDRAFT_657152 [Peniophora sp. CONT]|nr:hypothetical protein PENSPDRAFT_657152 [Peniophora sp. CONT]